ncbi:MAG: FkbM family methyltransferase [Chitinophagaceae bacterium]|nr:MAG: FkbM family methyltransferase [Chitinophagaceae bacterium]
MRKPLFEFAKLVGAFGVVPGIKIGVKKNAATKPFPVRLPNLPNDVWIRKGTSDWNAFKQVFVWKEYEYPIGFQPKSILDAGANVGYAALWFSRKFPDAKIVSLEPESGNFEMLKKNTASSSNIQPIKAGLWGRSCFLRIIATDWGNWGFRTEEVESETDDSIKALNIKEIMDSNGWETIDLLKMDIEGAERNVFVHGVNEWLPKVRMIFLELHDNVFKDCSKKVFKALLDHDFRVDVSGENIILINNSFTR